MSEKNKDNLILSALIIGFTIGVVFGMFLIFILFMFNIGNSLENNGLMYKSNCKVEINSQPICHTRIYQFDYPNNTWRFVQESDYLSYRL